MKRNNQPLLMWGETPFVSYTVCVNHVVEKEVSSTEIYSFTAGNLFLGQNYLELV